MGDGMGDLHESSAGEVTGECQRNLCVLLLIGDDSGRHHLRFHGDVSTEARYGRKPTLFDHMRPVSLRSTGGLISTLGLLLENASTNVRRGMDPTQYLREPSVGEDLFELIQQKAIGAPVSKCSSLFSVQKDIF